MSTINKNKYGKRSRLIPAPGQREYTTGQVAYLFGVSAHTVSNWNRKGLIECRRLPGDQRERRFTRQAVMTFSREQGFDLVADPDASRLVLWVGTNPLVHPPGVKHEVVYDAYSLGQRMTRTEPVLAVVIDVGVLGTYVSRLACQNLAKEMHPPAVVVLCLEDDSLGQEGWLQLGATVAVAADEQGKLGNVLEIVLFPERIEPCRPSPTSSRSGSSLRQPDLLGQTAVALP